MNSFSDIVEKFVSLGTALIPLLAVIALFSFAWGVGKFIRSTSNSTEMGKTKNFLIWGVVGLLILVSTWGIISWLRGEFGFGGGDLPLPLLRTTI